MLIFTFKIQDFLIVHDRGGGEQLNSLKLSNHSHALPSRDLSLVPSGSYHTKRFLKSGGHAH